MNMEKPDSTTWQDYIYEQSDGRDEIQSKQPAFVDYLVDETERAIRESPGVDESRFVIEESNRWVSVEADGWTMDGEDEVVRVRDALREMDIGDESVRVVCMPWSAEDWGPGPLPPRGGYEYTVQVELMREREIFAGAVGQASEKMNGKFE